MRIDNDRPFFEAHRYCRYCGRRLLYAQVDQHDRINGKAIAQELTKRCPQYSVGQTEPHDFMEFVQSYGSRIVQTGGWPG